MYKGKTRVKVLAGVAKPNPKLGQALGPLGINMAQFCKQFNSQTSNIRGDVPMKVNVYAFHDRTYKFQIKPPQTTWFIKRCTGINRFTAFAKHVPAKKVNINHVYQISKIKKELDPDFKNVELYKCVVNQCAGMGLAVTYDYSQDPFQQ